MKPKICKFFSRRQNYCMHSGECYKKPCPHSGVATQEMCANVKLKGVYSIKEQ